MGLRLNDPVPKGYRAKDYKEFYGKYCRIMPALLREGRKPMTISEIMQRRLEVLARFQDDNKLIENWWDNYCFSYTGIAQFGNKIKIVEKAMPLLKINPKSETKNCALVLPEKLWYKLKGPIFYYNKFEGMLYRYTSDTLSALLSKDQILKHPIWRAVVNEPLLNGYVEQMTKKYKYKNFMGISLNKPSRFFNFPTIQPLVLCAGSDQTDRFGLGWSNLDGAGNMDALDTRLVGVLAKRA